MDISEFIKISKSLLPASVYIVGAGKYGKILGRYFDKHSIPWEGYIDRNVGLGNINGKKVISYQEVTNNGAYYILSSFLHRNDMIQELRSHGIAEAQIVMYTSRDGFYDIYEDLVHWKKYTEKLKIFENKYNGKRCFIIGNGPSLKISDLEKLKNEITFACNSIHAVYKDTFWRPVFHCAYDNIFCKQMMSKKEDMKRLTSQCKAFVTSILGEGFEYRDCEEIENLFFVKWDKAVNDTGLPLFSDDCSKQIYLSGTVTYMMLQLAVYMGLKEIYLLGMDASFSVERYKDGKVILKNIENHQSLIEKESKIFSKDIRQINGYPYVADIEVQMEGYESAKQYADTHGIKIYNATRGGKLEVFERTNFDNLFA